MKIKAVLISLILMSAGIHAQYKSAVWSPDNGDGTYTNPVINADYSDPDVEVVGEDYYLTASSFNCMPGLPILHSKDLVNWEIIGHALNSQFPDSVRAQHGLGVYAPSIRHHNGEFYIYWGDPDAGVYMVKAKDPRGPWEDPVLVIKGKGFIDTTPLWDDDGRCYLVNGWANSRVGFNSLLTVRELSADGTRAIGNPVIVFDGDATGNVTTEGPKFYKRDGWYWILCPAGGVGGGWQLAMRSKSPFGPYEWKRVLERKDTKINGPHQGGWVHTAFGEDWFLHFQDKKCYGRVVHLQPVDWSSGWPIMGDGGKPYTRYRKPKSSSNLVMNPQESDEFDSPELGKQWQWQADYDERFGMPMSDGYFRLFTYHVPTLGNVRNLWFLPNMLLQKTPADEFTATTKVNFNTKNDRQTAGLIVMGSDYNLLAVERQDSVFCLEQRSCHTAQNNKPETVSVIETLKPTFLGKQGKKYPRVVTKDIYLRVKVKDGKGRFSYSIDGKRFRDVGEEFYLSKGRWIGAKIGLVAFDPNPTGRVGQLDIDWFRITPYKDK